ncbi:MAG: ABC transporter permease subunit [Bacteroidia bacterium]|jgi:Cu-processing system permease protein|nr:ABC transporter permease subunit [Bacteroidia bacterium]
MNRNKVLRFVLYDVIRSRSVIAYTFFLFLITFAMFYVSHDQSKVVISLFNIILLVVPLVNIVLGAIHYYNSDKFIQVLLTQPVKRSTIFWGEYLGFSISLSLSFLAGTLLPAIFYGLSMQYLYLMLIGVALTFIFEAIALYIAVSNADKARGLWKAILIWFYFSVVYDGLVMLVLFLFSDYPLQKTLLFLTVLNPIDISRTALLIKMDISALLGATGAVYQMVFGSTAGSVLAFGLLLCWIAAPLLRAHHIFRRKDF